MWKWAYWTNHLRLDQDMPALQYFLYPCTYENLRTGLIWFNSSSHGTIPNTKTLFLHTPLPVANLKCSLCLFLFHLPISETRSRSPTPQIKSSLSLSTHCLSECLGCGVWGWGRVLWNTVHLIGRETGIESRIKEQENFRKYAKRGKWLKLRHIYGIDIKMLSMYILMLNTICNKINGYVTHGPSQPIRDKRNKFWGILLKLSGKQNHSFLY